MTKSKVETFYKATRPDGTDFFTGTVLYEVGKRVRPLPHDGERRICGPGYVHAADVPSETLVNGRWPCRLFEVAGTPADRLWHKAAFRQLVVVRELDAHEALGPNGREAVALIERAGRLTPAEAQALGSAVRVRSARNVACHAARFAAFHSARNAAYSAVITAARLAAWGAAWAPGHTVGIAVGAVVVRDLISEEHFKTLYGPWSEVIKDVEITWT